MRPSRNHLGASSAPGSRIAELDGVRGIAILAVLLYHMFSYSMFREKWTGIAHLVMRVTDSWAHGVDLFFVLSGFLITGILLDTRSGPKYYRNFYGRRALRILPLYYAVLLIILLCYRDSGSFVLLSFFHLSNIAPLLGVTMFNGALWSLAVEEHFYLIWPLVVKQARLPLVALIAAAVWIAEPVTRGIAFPYVESVFPYTWFRMDGIAAGALLACFVRCRAYSLGRAKLLVWLLAGVGVLAEIAGSPWGIRQHQTLFGAIFEYPPVDLLSAALVLWGASMSDIASTGILRSRLLRLCGDLSYCIYLVHGMLMNAYDSAAHRLAHLPAFMAGFEGVIFRAAVIVPASFVVALISRSVLEQPALKLRRFFQAPETESLRVPNRPEALEPRRREARLGAGRN